jgi:signal transduction histidine kinase
MAAARTIIALTGILSLKLYPPQQLEHGFVIFWIVTSYFAYAAAVLALVLFIRTTPLPFGLATHLVDVLASAALMNLGEVADSPFFAFLTCPLLNASFRWGWRGILWTTIGLVALYATSSVVFWPALQGTEFEPTRFAVHSAHVLAVGATLALFSLQQRQFGDELIRLGTWPAAASTADQSVSEALEYAARVFDAPRAILVRSDVLEPWVELADWSAGQARTTRLPPGTIDPPVCQDLAELSFLAEGNVAFVHQGKGRLGVWRGHEPAINEAIRHRCDLDAALCFPLRSDEIDGWLFIPGRRKVAAEDFIIGALVAARIAVAFEQAAARSMLREASAAEDRLRLSRDLHDGVLQVLTGAALKLQAALHEHTVPPELKARIGEVGTLLAAEQRELRGFITRLRPGSVSLASEASVDLASYLEQLASGLRLQWGLDVVLQLKPEEASVSGRLAHQLRHILRESAANAAKHGKARQLTITAVLGEAALTLEVTNNGVCLHEQGTFDADELRLGGIGPRSLRERVAALGGMFTLKSDSCGIRLAMVIPLQDPGGRASWPGS